MKASAEIIAMPTLSAELPRKRYYAIGEVSELCGIKPHVLRYWEQEFPQLKPVKRRGNRRYYQFDDVEMVRRIRSLLYEQGFTIGGARQRLRESRAEQVASIAAAALPMAAPIVATASRKDQIKDLRRELEELLKRLPS
ncbi:MAG: MerR family transcriptional regulator [Pseudomonadota bacterium]